MNILYTINLSIFWILTVISVIGNVLVLVVMIKEPKLRLKSGNHYIIPLAVADLLATIMGPITLNQDVDFATCIGVLTVTMIVLAVSNNLLVSLSWDRYFAICRPNFYKIFLTSGIQKCLVPSCLIIGVGVGMYPALILNDSTYDHWCYLLDMFSKTYILHVGVSYMFASSLMIIVLYSLIFRQLAALVSLIFIDINKAIITTILLFRKINLLEVSASFRLKTNLKKLKLQRLWLSSLVAF